MTLTTTDFDNAKLDLQTVAEVSNVDFALSTTTNRSGDVIRTLLGQLALIGYLPPVAYAGAISFLVTDNTKTVERSGVVYAPIPSALPFTTTVWGTDSANFFAIQQDQNIADLVTLSGVAANATNLGTFTGTTIPNSQTNKQALQALETAVEATETDVADLVTLSGVAANAVNLGTFTGTTIANNRTNKQALQDLETALELRASGTYTPTETLVSNITSATAYKTKYQRIDDVVSFSGALLVFPTAAGSFQVRLSLPIASNFSLGDDASGVCSQIDNTSVCIITADATNNELLFIGNASGTGSLGLYFSGMYEII